MMMVVPGFVRGPYKPGWHDLTVVENAPAVKQTLEPINENICKDENSK